MFWYREVLKKYAVFRGRARRKEYWCFVFMNVVVSLIFAIIDAGTGLWDSEKGYGPLSVMYSFAALIPSWAVFVRRLHDTGRSAWWQLIALVPLIGVLVLLIFLLQDSQPSQNRYGPNPKQAQIAEPAAIP